MLSISIDIPELEPEDRRKGDPREILVRECFLANPYARVSPPTIFRSLTIINELTRFHL